VPTNALPVRRSSPGPTRRKLRVAERSVTEISKHLRLLAECGILETRRDGYYVLYSLRPDRIEPVSDALLASLGRAA
jgi:DNA-binding transcriptional ArsR family regulator